ncbi:MAG: type II CRISPR-associated endonuclease Cas1 [Planctomycetes bacterium]|nr:type II CRISPR-associated endonuclease Cas1 [Planctomycetota bacterium]
MHNRILDFSEEPAHLSARLSNLVIRRPDKPEVTLPFVDIAVLVSSHPQLTFTQAALAELAAAGAAFVTCDAQRLPVGLMLPLQGHFTQSERIACQVEAKLPVCKRAWQQLVRAKLRSQAAALRLETGSDAGLAAMATRVKSGDPENVEAQGARRYWALIFGDPTFRRDRDAADINRVLNYGYAVLRGMTGRAVCAVGLHPSIGLHHHNRYNQFVLADDVMEPFRPIVDRAAVSIAKTFGAGHELDKHVKAELIAALTGRYRFEGELRSPFDILSRVASSLVAVFQGERAELLLPDFDDFFSDDEETAGR